MFPIPCPLVNQFKLVLMDSQTQGWVRGSEGGLLYWVAPDCQDCITLLCCKFLRHTIIGRWGFCLWAQNFNNAQLEPFSATRCELVTIGSWCFTSVVTSYCHDGWPPATHWTLRRLSSTASGPYHLLVAIWKSSSVFVVRGIYSHTHKALYDQNRTTCEPST